VETYVVKLIKIQSKMVVMRGLVGGIEEKKGGSSLIDIQSFSFAR
jgi:hypothetical protein